MITSEATTPAKLFDMGVKVCNDCKGLMALEQNRCDKCNCESIAFVV